MATVKERHLSSHSGVHFVIGRVTLRGFAAAGVFKDRWVLRFIQKQAVNSPRVETPVTQFNLEGLQPSMS